MEPHDTNDVAAIRHSLRMLRVDAPRLRIRDAAESLGMTEAELLAAHVGHGVTALQPAWREIATELPEIGEALALTRNDAAVIETTGKYENVDAAVGLVLGERVDLRLFLERWRFGFAVTDDTDLGFHRSLQFFDATGTAVHKIFRTEGTDDAGLTGLIDRRRAQVQALEANVERDTAPARSTREADTAGLRAGWAAMVDTHDVFALLKRFGVERLRALELIGAEYARRVGGDSLQTALASAARTNLPVMIFVGNPGAVQIYTGELQNVRRVDDWVNVLDPGFNLHVRAGEIASSWVVQRPTRDGTVTSLDIFDRRGTLILQLFGKRKPGQTELARWRDLAAGL